MNDHIPQQIDILHDSLSDLAPGPAVVTFGEVLVRETPADRERPERTRLVHLSMAGSEYTLATGLARLGVPTAYITRVPDNPYGRAIRNLAREQGVSTDFIVWAPKTDLVGRLIYEIGRSPRPDAGVYQRMHSAASRLDAGMVDWQAALKPARLFHTSGITFGLAVHSQYSRNYCRDAFMEAIAAKPSGCLVGLDFNYRNTLWSTAQAREVMTPILVDHVDILVTTIEDMAQVYGIGCGQYAAEKIVDGDIGPLGDDDIDAFAQQLCKRFNLSIVAVTIRYPDSFELHRWESAAANAQGVFFRSPAIRPITLCDRLGGGDTWNAGFYYGLLTAGTGAAGLAKGVLVGDAATRLKQTSMFDLPIVDRWEIQSLLKADICGGGRRTSR